MSFADYKKILEEIRRVIIEVTDGRVVASCTSYDGEFSRLNEGEQRVATQRQLAKVCKAKAQDAAKVARSHHNGKGSEKLVKRELAERIMQVVPSNHLLRRPKESGVLAHPKETEEFPRPAPPDPMTAVCHSDTQLNVAGISFVVCYGYVFY